MSPWYLFWLQPVTVTASYTYSFVATVKEWSEWENCIYNLYNMFIDGELSPLFISSMNPVAKEMDIY